jgi:hypothetical protein
MFVSGPLSAVDSIPKPLPRIGVLQVHAGHSASDLVARTDRPMRPIFGECAAYEGSYPGCREGFSLTFGCEDFSEVCTQRRAYNAASETKVSNRNTATR